MVSNPKLLCITGIDGVGKTTHVNLLLQYYNNNSIKCEYRWLRFHHFFSLPLLAVSRLLGYTRLSKLGNKQKCSYHEFYKSKTISFLYPWILFLDTIIFTMLLVYIPIVLFRINIVCDRFIYDTLIDLSIALKDDELYRKPIAKLFIMLMPKKSKIIMLNLDKSMIFSRRPELSEDQTFNERYDLYRKFAREFKIVIVENDQEISHISSLIINEMEKSHV
jgi:thymidylate kinase